MLFYRNVRKRLRKTSSKYFVVRCTEVKSKSKKKHKQIRAQNSTSYDTIFEKN